MDREFYSEIQFSPARLAYTFVSVGRHGEIPKIVIFQEIEENFFNLFLGDFINDTVGSDQNITDNGDMPKVMATVIQILKLFLSRHANAAVSITGSEWIRKRLCARIAYTHYKSLCAVFEIQCTEGYGLGYKPYPDFNKEYVPYSFLVRLKIR